MALEDSGLIEPPGLGSLVAPPEDLLIEIEPDTELTYRQTNIKDWLRNKLNPPITDWNESTSKPDMIASGALTIGTGVAGALKLPLVFGPAATINILEATHSAPETGLLVGTGYGLWTLAVGKIIDHFAGQVPATAGAIGEKFPRGLAAAHSLPGYELNQAADQPIKSLPRRIGKSLLTHGWRGFTATTLSTAGYVGPAKMEGRQQDMNKLIGALGFDAGVLTGLVSGGAAEAISATVTNHPEIAHAIESNLSDTHRNMAIAIGLVGAKYVLDKLGIKRKSATI